MVGKYSMRVVQECINKIGRAGSSIFLTIHLTSGFWQMMLSPECRKYHLNDNWGQSVWIECFAKNQINYLAYYQPVPVIKLFAISSVPNRLRKFYTKTQTIIKLVAFCILIFLSIIVSVCANQILMQSEQLKVVLSKTSSRYYFKNYSWLLPNMVFRIYAMFCYLMVSCILS